MKPLLISVALVVAGSLSGCSGNSAALAKANAEAEAAKVELGKVKAEADAAKTELTQLKTELGQLRRLLPIPPITKPGEFKLYDGKIVVKVLEKDGLLGYDVNFESNNSGYRTPPEEQLKKENAVWVIYPESSNTLWVFWADRSGKALGNGPLTRYSTKREDETGAPLPGSEVRLFSPEPQNAIRDMPRVMRQALPKEYLEKYAP